MCGPVCATTRAARPAARPMTSADLRAIKALRERLEAEVDAARPRGRPGTIDELLDAFLHAGKSRWAPRDGEPSNRYRNCASSFRELRGLYGQEPAESLTPLRLAVCRQAMIERGLCCQYINRRLATIREAYRWAVRADFVPPAVLEGLACVQRVRPNQAWPAPPVQPVALGDVEATLPFVRPARRNRPNPVANMVRVQLLTGMRPGEVVRMCGVDVDQSAMPWVYKPPMHKNAWRGQERSIHLGPQTAVLLQPFLRREGSLFVTKFGRHYSVQSYGQAVRRAVALAVQARVIAKPWTIGQLRHTWAVLCRQRDGLETVQEGLGHRQISTSEIYAPPDRKRAEAYALRYG